MLLSNGWCDGPRWRAARALIYQASCPTHVKAAKRAAFTTRCRSVRDLRAEVPAAVDVDRGARDIGARIGAKHRCDAGDVVRFSSAPERQRIDELLAHLPPVRFGDARRLDESRRDRIDGDAERAELERQRLGEADDAA